MKKILFIMFYLIREGELESLLLKKEKYDQSQDDESGLYPLLLTHAPLCPMSGGRGASTSAPTNEMHPPPKKSENHLSVLMYPPPDMGQRGELIQSTLKYDIDEPLLVPRI